MRARVCGGVGGDGGVVGWGGWVIKRDIYISLIAPVRSEKPH